MQVVEEALLGVKECLTLSTTNKLRYRALIQEFVSFSSRFRGENSAVAVRRSNLTVKHYTFLFHSCLGRTTNFAVLTFFSASRVDRSP